MGLFNKKFEVEKKFKRKKYKLGIAFGGGGARGFAHIGVLKAFEENGITFDYVAGTSVGSLIGALYCAGISVDKLTEVALSLKQKDLRNSKLFFMPSSTDGIENIIKTYVGDINIQDLKKPLCIVAVDLVSGKEVDIKSGNLAKAVAGSCAVPGFFNPVDFGDLHLMDGGLQNTIPADIVREVGCKTVISVDVNPTRGYGTPSKKLLDIMAASIRIMMKSNAVKGKICSDIVIAPNLKQFKSTSLIGGEQMIEEGYKAAINEMQTIRKLLKLKEKQKTKFKFKNIFKFGKKENVEEEVAQEIEEKVMGEIKKDKD